MDRKINKLIAIVVALGVVWIWTMGFFNGVNPLYSSGSDTRASVTSLEESNSDVDYMQGADSQMGTY